MNKSNKHTWGLPASWMALVLGLVLSLPALAGDNRLSGTWEVVGTPDAGSMVDPFVNLARISADGSLVNIDPSEGAAVGDWEYLGAGDYAVTFHGFLPGGTLRFRVEAIVQVGHGGGSFGGPFVTDVSDGSGNVVFSFGGQVQASRL